MKEEFDILNNLKKGNAEGGFKVPDDYFETFESKMMERIDAEEKPVGKKIMMVIKPWISMAAIFTVVALVYYNTPYFTPNKPMADASISMEQDISFDFVASNFDESELIDIIVDETNDDIFNAIETDLELLEGLTYEDVEEIVIF